MEEPDENPQVGMPRWLIYGFIGKLVVVALITAGIVWYATSR
ncbi:hypothetical protein AMC99_02315 [Altererythrobacter epoxidivorans]|uniref:Uncharacterized protein n=1 Tax=Altererythrobacter epoxidivorans TaxID=361183 RepID=A0A0M4M611_9SPHN|nr:hypothetical protein [Altererythrobacter epoxidivorans]ALE17590.1 hypothetical protein AMC99_02315 [Altererythrobacter epoxidivorans]